MNGHNQCYFSVLNHITINLVSNEVEQNKEVSDFASVTAEVSSLTRLTNDAFKTLVFGSNAES